MVTHMGRGVFLEVSYTIAFARIRRAVCQRQLSIFVLYDYVFPPCHLNLLICLLLPN